MTKIQKNSALAGYGLGAALGVIRFAGAQTVYDFMLAGAMVGAEFAAVRLVERKAAKWAADREELRAREALRGQQESQVKSTAEELARRQGVLDETKNKIEKLEAECRHDHLMSDLKALISIAVNAVRNGYHAGIAQNYAFRTGYKEKVA